MTDTNQRQLGNTLWQQGQGTIFEFASAAFSLHMANASTRTPGRETWPTDSPGPGDSVSQAVRTHTLCDLFRPNSHSEDCLEEHPSLACWHETPLAIPAGRHCCRPDGSGDFILPPGFGFDRESPELQQGRAPHPFEPLFSLPRTRCSAAESSTSARHLRWGCSPS